MTHDSVDLVDMGKRIRDLRKKQKKSQKYLADLLYISPSYLTLIEQGKRTITLDVLVQIANVFDVSTDFLLFGNDFCQDEKNYKIFQKLYKNNSAQQLERALRIAEYYLALENDSSNVTTI